MSFEYCQKCKSQITEVARDTSQHERDMLQHEAEAFAVHQKGTTWIQQDMVNLRTSLHVKSLQVHPHKCIARVQSTAPLPFPCCGQTGIGPGFEVTLPEVEITNSLVFPTQPFRV